MKKTHFVLATLAIASAAAAQNFDFGYRVSDTQVNVFDDGKNTRVQLPQGMPYPVIVSMQAGQQQLVTPMLDGMNLVVPGLHAHLRLAWANNKSVDAHYSGALTQQRLGQGVSHGAVAPMQAVSAMSAPMPSQGPINLAAATQAAAQQRTPMVQAMPPEIKPVVAEETMKVAAKATDGDVVAKQAEAKSQDPDEEATELPDQVWAIKPTDGSLSRALTRWAREANQQLVYEAAVDVVAIAVEYRGDYWQALDGVLADTANGSYPLHGCQFNNVTRILHISQACDR